MRTFDPTDKYDRAERVRLNAPDWMIGCLAMNPDYVS